MSRAERRAQAGTDRPYGPEQPVLPVWQASVRMALVSVAGVVAAGLIAAGLPGIAPQARLGDAASLGPETAAVPVSVAADWT